MKRNTAKEETVEVPKGNNNKTNLILNTRDTNVEIHKFYESNRKYKTSTNSKRNDMHCY